MLLEVVPILDELQFHIILHELLLQDLVLVLPQAFFNDLLQTNLLVSEPARWNSENVTKMRVRTDLLTFESQE